MMYVVNLALSRPDGKIETDTFFTEKKPTQETANEIAEKHNCSAIVAICGTFKEYSYVMQEKNTWFSDKREDYLLQSDDGYPDDYDFGQHLHDTDYIDNGREGNDVPESKEVENEV